MHRKLNDYKIYLLIFVKELIFMSLSLKKRRIQTKNKQKMRNYIKKMMLNDVK